MIFVGVETIMILICILIARYMVDHKKWLAKRMIIGEDDETTKQKMEQVVNNFVRHGILKLEELSSEHEMKIKITKGFINSVSIETERTLMFWDLTEHSKEIVRKGSTRNQAIILITVFIWLPQFLAVLLLLIIFVYI